MKKSKKVYFLISLSSMMLIANAEVFTVSNNTDCSSKTIYQTFSSPQKIKIKDYKYDTAGLYVEHGSITGNSHKDINLKNDHGTVQIIATTLVNMKKGTPQTTEYFITENKFCTISDKKKCFDAPGGKLTSGIQMLCGKSSSAPNLSKAEIDKGIANGTITVGGTLMKPINNTSN